MRQFGLIGYPLSHTFSKNYFGKKFSDENIIDTAYDIYELKSIDDFCELIKSKNPSGLNVTIPYKEQVIPFLDELNKVAAEIGAVNTIRFENGKSIGFNTDAYGFEYDLLDFLKGSQIQKALILGTGGASKAVAYVLHKLKIEFNFVSRKEGYINYQEMSPTIIQDHHLIVNTTPLGMSPNVDSYPELPYDNMGEKHYLYDLVYNPEKTLFLKYGQVRGAHIRNGYDMLVLQAEEAWRIWNFKK